jgi:hypothetical protein
MLNKVVLAAAVLVVCVIAPSVSNAESVVEQNSNVVGRTPPGYYRGIPGMQDNEVSCAINPILPRNIVCAWNASGGSDDAIGDTWLRFSESLDAGRTFFNRYLNGSNLNPATGIGQQFAADPVMMCWPGGCGTVMLASSRGENGGEGGGIYIQWMADANFETGFRKAFKVNLDRVYRSTGSKFADKPHALYMLDKDNPGTVTVSFEAEMPDGSTQVLTREWPKARILVAFALFNPSKNDIEILSMYTDDYGTNWSNPKQVAVTSGRDQGISIAAIDDTVFYGFRRFANSGDSDDIMGVISNNRGVKIGKPFVIASDVCVYDAPTLPSADNSSLASARSNDFPWASQDGSKFVMVYSERRLSSDGGCLTIPGEPSDSRIMAVVGSSNGKNWSSPIEVDERPDDEHGFQFMPVVDCVLDVCQIAWWDSRRDSQRTIEFLEAQDTPGASAALDYFLGVPILADFHSPPLIVDSEIIEYGYQFKRTADMFTRKVRLRNNGMDFLGESTIASRYRQGLYPDGSGGVTLIEREANPFNVKAYKTNSVPFMSDYSSLTSLKHRYVFDPDNPSQPPYWEDNTGLNPLNDTLAPQFWLAWTDARNMRGAIYTYGIDGRPPYARMPATSSSAKLEETAGENDVGETLTAESVEDFNPAPDLCTAVTAPPDPDEPGALFLPLHNRVKDSDIYGAMIEDRTTAWALNPTKTLGLIQRTYVVVAENESDSGKVFRFDIANQPFGFETDPKTARASWRQLPFDPATPEFQTEAPITETFEAVGPRSSASVALFLVSDESVNPVTIDIFDVTGLADPNVGGALVNSVIVNGAVEAGPLLQADGTPNDFEIHNPFVFAPDFDNPLHYNPGHYTFDQANPDQFNPDQYNPDQFNPDLFNPDQFNPDQFNPDQFNPDQFNPDQYNPDQFNPDQFNPDQFNPDQFNPDQFNPDQFNPDQFNLSLSDSDDLHNAEIPKPEFSTNFERDPGGLVSKVDINYGLKNVGNTLTPYTVDFAVSDYEVLQLITSGKIAIQLIAWQNKQVDDTQFCEPRITTENRVIAAANNFDVTELDIPTILDNRIGALTYFVLPDDILQVTFRFIGRQEDIRFVEGRLRDNIISWVFTSQAANTDSIELFDVEQVINDRTPPTFNFPAGNWQTLEATEPGGVELPTDYITADKDGVPVPVSCIPALGSFLILDEDNDGSGTDIAFSCETVPLENGVVARFTDTLSVVDTMAPFFTNNPYPGGLTVEATSPAGAVVDYDLPTAADMFGVDDNVSVSCLPAPGSTFPFTAPGPTSHDVTCVATDFSGNSSEVLQPPESPSTFQINVTDTSAPVIDDDVSFVPPAPPILLGSDESSYELIWDFDVTDADAAPTVECEPGTLLSANPPNYVFNHEFEVGVTQVTCTATDSNGQTTPTPLMFSVEIIDETAPVITLLGDETITLEAGSGPYTDAGATAIDNGNPDVEVSIDIDSSDVDTTTAGTYTVTITATDPSGNTSTVTRTVIVEFSYGLSGIIPSKTNVKLGSSNPLRWAWLGADGTAADSSGDMQYLRIEDCDTGDLIIDPAGDPGTSGFRFKADNWWQYNWDSTVPKSGQYCAYVVSGLTGQEMNSPRIRVR